MSTARRLHWTYDDYRHADEMSDVKLEYCNGEIYAMAGGTPAHAELSAQLIYLLKSALGPSCSVYSSDLKVRIEATDLTTYPDATVVCGPRETASIDAHALVNPTVLVEVTSPSTVDYDRGNKLSHYKQLPSLKAVLLVSHQHRAVTAVLRTPDGWAERDFLSGETIVLEEPALAVPVDAVYAGVVLA